MVTTKSLLIHCNKLEEGMTTLLIYGRPKQKSLLTRKDAQSSLLDTEEKSKVHENFSFSIVLALSSAVRSISGLMERKFINIVRSTA